MSEKRRGSSGLPTVGLTLILLVVCAVLSIVVITLIAVPFFNKMDKQSAVAGSAPQEAGATATIDFEKGPPPPGTPTGEIPKRPTLDVTQAKKLPTSVVPPDVPTLESEEDFDAVAPTFEPIVALAPSDEWATYRDPNLGFSFGYPKKDVTSTM